MVTGREEIVTVRFSEEIGILGDVWAIFSEVKKYSPFFMKLLCAVQFKFDEHQDAQNKSMNSFATKILKMQDKFGESVANDNLNIDIFSL